MLCFCNAIQRYMSNLVLKEEKNFLKLDITIIIGGTHNGVMKLVGEAIKRNFHVQKKEEVKLLGIVYWNLLKDKDILKKAQENPVYKTYF